MKKVIFLVSLFILSGCFKEAISHETTDINDINIELLFEKDGCKMYRFKDGMRYIYWSNCEGGSEYSYTQHNGKTTSSHRIQQITSK